MVKILWLLFFLDKEILDFLNMKILEIGKYNLKPKHLLFLLIVLFITRILSALLKTFVLRYEKRKNLDKGSALAFYQLAKYLLYSIAFVIALDLIGVRITILLAGSTALFVGLGLGLQQTFNDLVSGIILLFEGSIKVNDILNVDNEVGMVKKIGLRTSLIETRDGIQIIIPNSKFVTDKVINYTHTSDYTRFEVTVSVAYGSDIRKVEQLLLEATKDIDGILQDTPPWVSFMEFGDSGLEIRLWFISDRIFTIGLIKSQLRYKIYQSFADNNITIPYPQRDVHIKQQ